MNIQTSRQYKINLIINQVKFNNNQRNWIKVNLIYQTLKLLTERDSGISKTWRAGKVIQLLIIRISKMLKSVPKWYLILESTPWRIHHL